MMKAKQSKHCRLEADRISQLPDNVIDKILTSLPIVDAAKAAVLLKNWKRGWKHISMLVFDSSFGKKFERAGRPNLLLQIYQTLFLHVGVIDGFTLSISSLESCPEINPLIHFLSEKKVKHLKIHFANGNLHVLPSYLFSCFPLSTLDLTGCVFNPPHSFGGFSQLITLVLYQVDITGDFFGMFISNCPLLQQLWLKYCNFTEVYTVSIIAPNLRTFIFMGCEMFFFFVSAPLLDQLELHDDYVYKAERGKPLNFDTLKKSHLDEVCNAVPSLRKMNISQSFFTILEARDLSGEPSHSPNCLQQLKELHVNSICFGNLDYVSSLIRLIRRSPNLEQFSAEIHRCDIVGHVARSFFKILVPDQYDVSCNRLQTVELIDFNGTYLEMEFVKFILSKSPQLKTMTIHQASKDDQKGLQILRKIVRFQRASAVVDINYCDPEVAQG